MSVTDSRSSEDEDGRPPLPWQIQEAITAFDAVYTGALRAALDAAGGRARSAVLLVDAVSGLLNATASNSGNMDRATAGAIGSLALGFAGAAIGSTLPIPGGAIIGATAGAYAGTKLGEFIYDNRDIIDFPSLGDAIDTAFTDAYQNLTDSLESIGDSIEDHLDNFGDHFTDFADDISDYFGDHLTDFGDELDNLGDQVGDFLDDLAGDGLDDLFGDTLDDVFGDTLDDVFGDDSIPSWPFSLPSFEFPFPFPGFPFHFPNFFNPPISPLVLDLDGDGIELVALSDARAYFDLDGDGFAQRTGWVASDDALLAIDRDNNGRVDDISELFGNGTVDGFTELRSLDSNGDGVIDASDAQFGELLLWQDRNGNGWSEGDELQSLSDSGITSINLRATVTDTILVGHRISHTSSFARTDSTTGTIVDAWFENDRHISVYLPEDGFTLHEDVRALPELRGYGVVPSLWVAMTLDAGLRTRVRDLMKDSGTLSLSDFRDRVEAMILDWTGADTAAPASRGPGIDARHLVAIEALMGTGFDHRDDAYGTNPGPIVGVALEADFQSIVDMMTVRLMGQSAVSSYLIDIVEETETADLSDVYGHRFSLLGTLFSDILVDELSGNLDAILDFYVRSHAQGSTPSLNIEDTLALLRMLRIDFGTIGIGGHLTMPPLPHHRAYGSVPRRFDRIRPQQGCRVWGGRASRNGGCVGPAGPPHVRPCASTPSASQRRWRLGPLRVPGGGAP